MIPAPARCARLHPDGSPGDARLPVRCQRPLGHSRAHFARLTRAGYIGTFTWTDRSYLHRGTPDAHP